MESISLPLLAAALIVCGPINAEPLCADLALVLAVDSSSSIDDEEFRMQVQGYAAAFADPAVLGALQAAGTVDVAAVFWADSAVPPIVIEWKRIRNIPDARDLADSFLLLQRNSFGDTDLGGGLAAALDLIDLPDQCSARAVINISGDGRASRGDRRMPRMTVAAARQRADAMGVTINGLAILNAEPALADYYRKQVITGPGAFVLEARDFKAFGDAIVQKLEQEIRPQLTASVYPVEAAPTR